MEKSFNISPIKYDPKSKDYYFGTFSHEVNWMEQLAYDVFKLSDTTTNRANEIRERSFLFFCGDTIDETRFESTKQQLVLIETLLIEFVSASTRVLMRQLADYTSQITSIKLSVLRNTRIHSLSIFFGLCCSSSGYIFDAITGASSHPCPVR